ncbi:hypothetical protein Tco_0309549 [Tanacetum coccineum]
MKLTTLMLTLLSMFFSDVELDGLVIFSDVLWSSRHPMISFQTTQLEGKPQQDDTGFVDGRCSRHMTGLRIFGYGLTPAG